MTRDTVVTLTVESMELAMKIGGPLLIVSLHRSYPAGGLLELVERLCEERRDAFPVVITNR